MQRESSSANALIKNANKNEIRFKLKKHFDQIIGEIVVDCKIVVKCRLCSTGKNRSVTMHHSFLKFRWSSG